MVLFNGVLGMSIDVFAFHNEAQSIIESSESRMNSLGITDANLPSISENMRHSP